VVDAAAKSSATHANRGAVQTLADRGAVLVTARVHPSPALFVAEERGSHAFKGVPEPVTLFRLVRLACGDVARGRALLRR